MVNSVNFNVTDVLDDNGLNLASYTDVLDELTRIFTQIYATDGDSVNFGSETPDGQFINILSQMASDNRELAREIYNSFNPDNCIGSVQDQRYALNYITRDSGSYTIQQIDVTISQTVTLQGLGNGEVGSYTVSDNAGNQWYLIDTVTLEYIENGNNTHSLTFRAQNKGAVMPTINTITNQTTKVLGVVSVNNSQTYTSIGSDEESDVQFRIRRNYSTATKGQNNYDSMLGQILELPTVTDARLYVNSTSSISQGVPPYSIWVIVEGGNTDDIANVIYQNSAGLPTYANASEGYVSTEVESISGQVFPITFNREVPERLYVKFDYKPTSTLSQTELDNIIQIIAGNFATLVNYSMGQVAETSELTDLAAQAISMSGGNGYALNLEISTDGTTYTDYIEPTSMQYKFTVNSTDVDIQEYGE